MKNYNQWILVKYVQNNGKINKLPVDHRTLQVFTAGSNWQHDPEAWLPYEKAVKIAALLPDHGIGFLFTSIDPFFFLDIDKCLEAGRWNKTATNLLTHFPGAFVEISISGEALHVFGSYTGAEPPHGCKNTSLNIELYTSGRFVAFTDTESSGDPCVDCTTGLQSVINHCFPATTVQVEDQQWTTEPLPHYTHLDDDELIKKACANVSVGSKFAGKATFSQLWNNDITALGMVWPDPVRDYDYSSADAALVQHLAFWTGNNCQRILDLMQKSQLVRDKWDRPDYLNRTILRAVASQVQIYSIPESDADVTGLTGTPKQVAWAANIRAQIITANPELMEITDSKLWIDNQGKTAAEMMALITPIDQVSARPTDKPELTVGYQLLEVQQQIEHFKGCCYVQSEHRVFIPSGMMLKPDQFNATYGGYKFSTGSGESAKPTKKAWEAFTENQLVRWPIAENTCFRPALPPGEITNQEGRPMLNCYVPVNTSRTPGDPTPFLLHAEKVLPVKTDRDILFAYMAAIVQYKGFKFQWTPLIQGVQGNGKTLFTRCLVEAVGKKYSHMPRPHTISENFNAWLFYKIFIGIEDIFIPEQKRELAEILKPMITGEWLAIRKMQTDEGMQDSCANFLLNSNYKGAVQKTENDRRYCVFYCAQQLMEHIIRDGMDGNYFPDLYKWLQKGGYGIVTDWLYSYQIPDELNPATSCHRAPRTSSTSEAIETSLGPVEQNIIDVIEEGLPGFAGGWISSTALDTLLRSMGKDRMIHLNKRRELLQTLGYDWHPHLLKGRVNNMVLPDKGKPRLFIKKGHIAASMQGVAMIEKAYQKAQISAAPPSVGEIFKARSGTP